MKSLFSGLVAVALVASVMTEGADARGGRGGFAGRAPSGPRPGGAGAAGNFNRPSAPHPGTSGVRPSAPGANRPNNLTGSSFPTPASQHLGGQAGAGSLSEHLGISSGAEKRSGEVRSAASEAVSQWTSGPEPFSPAWYAEHPQAWQYTHPHADAVVAATAVGVARWLAVPYAAAAAGGTSASAVAVEGEPAESSVEEVATEEAVDEAVAETAAEALQWMTIGVYRLGPAGQTEASRTLQLAVDREGNVRGSHYDLISDEVDSVQGKVNKADLRVIWSIGEKGKTAFEAPLDELTGPEGEVTVRFPGGKTESWRISQLRK